MVQIDKRRLIWQLHSRASEVLSYYRSKEGRFERVRMAQLLEYLQPFGFDVRSAVLHEIVHLALEEDNNHVDIALLFHILQEAVGKILDRNTLFWNTVMSVSSTSVAWIDFRRKLSKWLSTNGMGLAHIKNVISYVQQNVDKSGSGIVRKDAFLRFTEEIMGIDCLLSTEALTPETLISVNLTGIHKPVPLREQPSEQRKEEVRIHHPVSRHESLSPISVPESVMPSSQPTKSHVTGGLTGIRTRLGVDSLSQLFGSRLRIFFALNRIVAHRENSRVQQAPKLHDQKVERTKGPETRLLIALIDQVSTRLLWSAFSEIRSMNSGSHTSPVQAASQEEASGPSWTVTIQAVAVANLFGIFRTSLSRCLLPAFFAVKAGCRVDCNFPPRKVLWAQSKQGKKDSQAAMGAAPRNVLQPIQENVAPLEFDLSS